jgi:SAM-dependent methyltransferase
VSGAEQDYAARLEGETNRGLKRLLDVQRPYRWNIRRLDPGRTLDVGCGVGRHLVHLPAGSAGVDFNEDAIARARTRGCDAYTAEEFLSEPRGPFESILLSHILEHLTLEEAQGALDTYLPYLEIGGRVIVICPQEKGFLDPPGQRPAEEAKGEGHVTFFDSDAIGSLLKAVGLKVENAYSFPFPRPIGRIFRHNETVVIARHPGDL